VKNLLPHILIKQKNNSGSKFFTFHFSLLPFFRTFDYVEGTIARKNPKYILVFCSLIRTFAPVKPKYKQNYGRLPGG